METDSSGLTTETGVRVLICVEREAGQAEGTTAPGAPGTIHKFRSLFQAF